MKIGGREKVTTVKKQAPPGIKERRYSGIKRSYYEFKNGAFKNGAFKSERTLLNSYGFFNRQGSGMSIGVRRHRTVPCIASNWIE